MYFFFIPGYNYSFAFLSTDCGIHVDRKSIQPLYRQILNIKYPTMAFIGIPESAIITTFDVQVLTLYFLHETIGKTN